MLKSSDLKNVLRHIINNNRFLEENNKKKNAIAIESIAGIGKTSIVEQVARENNLHFAKLSLSQTEQVGDIIGFPIREFEFNDGVCAGWINEKELDNKPDTVKLTGKTRTTYCPPAWVPTDQTGTVLLLDDYTRAAPHMLQSVMELIDRQEFISWKLPKDCHIFLTSNPDNGDYIVSSVDEAMETRFIKVKMKFDIQDWAKWAEMAGLDSRCINFLLLNPELVSGKINARIITDFFNSISSLENFSNEYAFYLISNLGAGSVGEEFTQMFIMFINNKLDKIPSPDQIFGVDTNMGAVNLIKGACGNVRTDTYKQNIASVISTRISNYVTKICEEKTIKVAPTVDRLKEIILSDCFSNDIVFNFVKTLNKNSKMSSLLSEPKIARLILK